MLGLPISTQEDWTENIRGRVDRYSMGLGSQPRQASGYENGVSGRLNVILGVLREHPALDQAIYTADDQLVLKLDLGIHRVAGHPLVFLLRGLVDYAVEHTPKVATEAFARVVQYEENEGLTFYSMMTLRGLHVEGIHEIASGISLMSWQETRKYMPDTIIRSEINALEGVGGEPIGAVVSPTKWRPVFVHAGYDIEKRTWPERSPSFRDDALLFIELIAVTHGSPVRSSGFTYDGVEQEVEHLVGRSPSFGFSRGIVRDDRSNVRVSNTPEMSTKAFVEAVRLFAKMRNEKGRLRLGLRRRRHVGQDRLGGRDRQRVHPAPGVLLGASAPGRHLVEPGRDRPGGGALEAAAGVVRGPATGGVQASRPAPASHAGPGLRLLTGPRPLGLRRSEPSDRHRAAAIPGPGLQRLQRREGLSR